MQQIKQQCNERHIVKTRFYLIWSVLVYFCFGTASGLESNNFTRNHINSPITLYVSLGMPDHVLKEYLVQAHKFHIPIILRGLYTKNSEAKKTKDKPIIGSFRDTASRIFTLLKDQHKNANAIKGGVLINPMRYRRYHIKVVPALVIANKDSTKPDNDTSYDVLYGNIPIQSALALIVKKSENEYLSLIAQRRLDQYATKIVNNVKVN